MSKSIKRKPTHRVYVTKPGDNNKAYWNRIDGAWEHKDGKGFYIKLETLPVNGEIVIRKIPENSQTAGAA